MSELIEFAFRGKLAERHQMDFYEAGRFQYGASRLLVKLDQFRRHGRFPKKITDQNRSEIILQSQDEGSFLIATLAPLAPQIADLFLQVSVGALSAYLADRVLKPASDENLRQALQNNANMIEVFEQEIEGREQSNQLTLNMLQEAINRGDQLAESQKDLYERLLSETERRARAEAEANELQKITAEQEAKLVAMASPLLKDMSVALRQSATSMTIKTSIDGLPSKVVFLDRQMASEIETDRIDEEPTVILVKIVQYNRENGWGKLRMAEHVGLLSFVVPSERKQEIRGDLLEAMDEDETYIECLFVRTPQGIRKRAIILAILDIDEVEAG